MTQVFADDGPVIPVPAGMLPDEHEPRIPRQAGPANFRPGPAPGPAPGSSIMPGKGVRPVRCVGCSRDTLPRQNDGAPLCQRCSEVLALADAGTLSAVAGPLLFRAPRWLRWRPEFD
jgi:hypothetical protein